MSDRKLSKERRQTDGIKPVGLTQRQAEVLETAEALSKKKGYPPTYGEIGAALNLNKAGVKIVIDQLAIMELVTREEREPRTLLLTGRPYYVKAKEVVA